MWLTILEKPRFERRDSRVQYRHMKNIPSTQSEFFLYTTLPFLSPSFTNSALLPSIPPPVRLLIDTLRLEISSTTIIDSLNWKRSAAEHYILAPIAKFTGRPVTYRCAFHWTCCGYAKRYNQWWIPVSR
jgi:hypothetical protein